MGYTTEEGRTQILDDSGAAVEELAVALTSLGDVYEELSDNEADELEAQLFGPLQKAYGQLTRTLSEFAARTGLPSPRFDPAPQGPVEDPRATLERAADAIQAADDTIAELQDTLLPVEVGDQELRAGLSGTRTVIARLPAACDDFVSMLGR